jgi:hypothetical protein
LFSLFRAAANEPALYSGDFNRMTALGDDNFAARRKATSFTWTKNGSYAERAAPAPCSANATARATADGQIVLPFRGRGSFRISASNAWPGKRPRLVIAGPQSAAAAGLAAMIFRPRVHAALISFQFGYFCLPNR